MIKLIYGSENEQIDVSDKLAALDGITVDAALSFNSQFGDPAPGNLKSLRVEFQDGVRLHVPENRTVDVRVRAGKALEIVVARFNETLEWTRASPVFAKYDYTIYNKGPNQNFVRRKGNRVVNVPNLGRNDQTYVYHIVKNYHNLADVTIFLPGSTNTFYKFINALKLMDRFEKTGKASMFAMECEDLVKEFGTFELGRYPCSERENQWLNPETELTPAETRPFAAWYRRMYGDEKIKYYNFHGLLSVDRDVILKRPLSFYEEMLRQLSVSSNPEVGHYVERAWHAMFQGVAHVPLKTPFIYDKLRNKRQMYFVTFGQNCVAIVKQAVATQYFDHINFYSDSQSIKLKFKQLQTDDILCFANVKHTIVQHRDDIVKLCDAILCGDDYNSIVYLKANGEYDESHFFVKKTPETAQIFEEWSDFSRFSSLWKSRARCFVFNPLNTHNETIVV